MVLKGKKSPANWVSGTQPRDQVLSVTSPVLRSGDAMIPGGPLSLSSLDLKWKNLARSGRDGGGEARVLKGHGNWVECVMLLELLLH